MNKFTIFTSVLLWLWGQLGLAQRDYSIYLQAGAVSVPEFHDLANMDSSMLAAYRFKQHYYLVVQFNDIPDAAQEAQLAEKGIELIGYLPNYAYVAKVPVNTDWSKIGARAILPLQPPYKLSRALALGDYPAHAVTTAGIKIQAYPFPGIAVPTLLESLKRSGFTGEINGQNGVLLIIEPDRLLDLAGHPAIMYLEFPPTLPQAEGWTGRTAQRLNLVGSGPNIGYDGAGVALAIADDGKVAHDDLRGRITDFNTADGGTHGDMTTGIAIGAGNLNPLAMGMAPGAYLYLYSIENYPHIENAVQNLQQRRVVITSTSYGEGCGGVYDQSAQILDAQVFQNRTLFHVWSAGNSGEAICNAYSNAKAPDGGRFGNITGGRKSAKNGITVGNTSYEDRVMLSSSRGPTQDGRIKPDIVAHGQGNLSTDANNAYQQGGGTSAAAPSLAGTAALLYQAYRELNENQDPSSALIKAAILNTADDLGNPGPDYVTGWGRVHAGRAMEVIRNKSYLHATVANNAAQTHIIAVPQNVRQIRIMLYWHDPEGLPFAGRSLVNDLDMSLTTPSGEVFRPWALSTATHQDSLNKNAYRGIDRVNNAEQITIDDPSAGTYTVNVRGHLVPRGPQSYYLVFLFVKDELSITYPIGGEGFVPGETEVIRWDAFGNIGTFALEYSVNDGSTWQPIANNIAGHQRHYNWQVPDMTANRVRIRVKRNGKNAASPNPFCIMELPDFRFFYVAPGTAAVRWQAVPGANAYDIYALGNKYMDLIGTTSDTSFNLTVANWQSNWYSVRARHTNGAIGRRANAKWYQHRPCEAQLNLRLKFDLYPSETFWEIKDAAGRVWASGGPYVGETPNSTKDIAICLPYGCYSLHMHDSYNDGMCCTDGQGSYRLTDNQGRELAAGGQFGSFIANNFCVDANTSSLPLEAQVNQIRSVSCFNGQDGAASVVASGGSGNYTFLWSNGANTASVSGLKAGTYHVTISDDHNNRVSKTVVIAQPSAIDIQLTTQIGACGQNIPGAITANVSGGTAPYSYRWNNGSGNSVLSGLNPGIYSLTVTDANGCSQSASVNLQASSSISLGFSVNNVSCFGGNDGSATVVVSGGALPYRYAWSTGSPNASIVGLGAAIYSVTVTDNQGCRATAAVNILQPPAVTLSFSITEAFGTNNGAINLAVSGGTPSYSYRWSNGATTEDLTDLGPGTYIVTVTDSKNCKATGSARIEFQDGEDCSARGSSTRFEWIESVAIGALTNTSGNNNGYSDFTDLTQNMMAGGSYPVVLVPGYSSTIFREFWNIWIDLNHDGDFLDAGEEVYAAQGFIGSISGTFRLPANARPGATKLRIAMRYPSAALPCGTFAYGEVEDYGVFILPGSGATSPDQEQANAWTTEASASEQLLGAMKIFPNPASGQATLRYFSRTGAPVRIVVSDLFGKEQWQTDLLPTEGWNEIPLSVRQWPSGQYFIRCENAEDYFVERLIINE